MTFPLEDTVADMRELLLEYGAEEGKEVLDRRTLSASLDERAWQMQVSDR